MSCESLALQVFIAYAIFNDSHFSMMTLTYIVLFSRICELLKTEATTWKIEINCVLFRFNSNWFSQVYYRMSHLFVILNVSNDRISIWIKVSLYNQMNKLSCFIRPNQSDSIKTVLKTRTQAYLSIKIALGWL